MINKSGKDKFAVFIVPTGIGASIGGFAGDASSYARKIATRFPLIVNPNVVNAACFSGISPNMFYTEGWTISQLFKGNLSLIPSENNKIGIVFDKAISQKVLNIHINTINAVKTVYGCNIIGYEITEEPCGVDFFMTDSGISSGALVNNETLLKSAKKLLSRGAETIAVVCHFDEPPEDNYMQGGSPDIIGGVEAIISHYLTRELMVPVVHAPAFEKIDITSEIVDPRAASEYITPTFLPCLLLGLQNAPLIYPDLSEKYININDVFSLIMPGNSLGSSIVFDAIQRKIPVIAVESNKTVLNIDKCYLSVDNGIINIETYDDCCSLLEEVVQYA